MKLVCERCNGIIDTTFDKYERVERIEKGCGTDEIILCATCSVDFDKFLYKKPKTFNDAEQSYLQSAT